MALLERSNVIPLALAAGVVALVYSRRRVGAAGAPKDIPITTTAPGTTTTTTTTTAPGTTTTDTGPVVAPVQTPAEAEATTREAVRTQPDATVRTRYLDYAQAMRALGREPTSLSDLYREEKMASPAIAQLLETVREAIRTKRADSVVRDVYLDYATTVNAVLNFHRAWSDAIGRGESGSEVARLRALYETAHRAVYGAEAPAQGEPSARLELAALYAEQNLPLPTLRAFR